MGKNCCNVWHCTWCHSKTILEVADASLSFLFCNFVSITSSVLITDIDKLISLVCIVMHAFEIFDRGAKTFHSENSPTRTVFIIRNLHRRECLMLLVVGPCVLAIKLNHAVNNSKKWQKKRLDLQSLVNCNPQTFCCFHDNDLNKVDINQQSWRFMPTIALRHLIQLVMKQGAKATLKLCEQFKTHAAFPDGHLSGLLHENTFMSVPASCHLLSFADF